MDKVIWSLSLNAKKATLLWLLTHQAIWTRSKAAKIGKGDGTCPRCKNSVEDLKYLFFECPFNQSYFQFLNKCFVNLKPHKLSDFEIMLGECIHLDIPLWHNLRSTLLFNIWKERNSAVFNYGCTSHLFIFMTEAKMLAMQATKRIVDVVPRDQKLTLVMQRSRWQSWQAVLGKLYSKERLLMIEGILSACTSLPP